MVQVVGWSAGTLVSLCRLSLRDDSCAAGEAGGVVLGGEAAGEAGGEVAAGVVGGEVAAGVAGG